MLPSVLRFLNDVAIGVDLAQRLLTWMQPLPNANLLLTTVAALASVVALALLSGLAVGSVMTLLATLLALYFIATEVLGLSIEVALP